MGYAHLKVSLKPFQRLVRAAGIGGRLRRGEPFLGAFFFLCYFFFLRFLCQKEKVIFKTLNKGSNAPHYFPHLMF